MKIFVMVDMEGISGICRSSQVMGDDPEYQRARRFMTWDANACVDGCFAGGARKVVVRDAHHHGFNFLWEELDERAEWIQGASPLERMPRIASFDGLILLGYHAMGGTRQAILEHTMSSGSWQNFWMNGVRSGELGIDAGLAGDHGVPTILASGDDKLCREARRFIKGIVTVQVKTGLDCQGGQLLPMDQAHELIRQGTAKAVAKCKQIRPYRVKHPVRMRLELVSRRAVPAGRKGVKVIDGRTYEVSGPTVEEALNAL
ncbi:MAG TPA: M55 family metallopeptidase [Phycisphaerae bacterium]|nr:M55 family metallopeptidase [Phycisphaerae bacterium]